MDKIIAFLISAEFIASVIILVIAIALCAVIRRLSVRSCKVAGDDLKRRSSIRNFFSGMRFVVLLIAFFMILLVNHINVGSLVASLGIASAVVGLALQDVIKDFVMGYFIQRDRFYEIGDVIRHENGEHQIIQFNALNTKLRNIEDGSVTTLCNRNINGATVVSRIFDIDVPLPYEEPFERIEPILNDICRTISETEGVEDCAFLGTKEFASSAILYRLRIRCAPADRFDKRIECMKIIQAGLHDAGVEIPFTQIDIHQK